MMMLRPCCWWVGRPVPGGREPAETPITRSWCQTYQSAQRLWARGLDSNPSFFVVVYFRPNEPQFSCTLKPKMAEAWPLIIIEKRSRMDVGHFCQIELLIPANITTCLHKHTSGISYQGKEISHCRKSAVQCWLNLLTSWDQLYNSLISAPFS